MFPAAMNETSYRMYIDHILMGGVLLQGNQCELVAEPHNDGTGDIVGHADYHILYKRSDVVVVQGKPPMKLLLSCLPQLAGCMKSSRDKMERAERWSHPNLTTEEVHQKLLSVPSYGILTSGNEWVFAKYFFDATLQQWRFIYSTPVVIPMYTRQDDTKRQGKIKNLQKDPLELILSSIATILNMQVKAADASP